MHRCLLGLIPLFIACSPDVDSGKQVFRYNEPEGITSLDPAFARNLEHMWAVDQLFDGLVEMGPDLRVRPAIAQKWLVLDSGLTYLFVLRDDVRFHDDACFSKGRGRQVKAVDVHYSFERIMDPRTASPGSWIFEHVDHFEVRDDRTFVIHLKQPFPPFLGILTMAYASIVPKEAVDHYGNDWRAHPVGCGPFRFGHWLEGVKLSLLRNEHYHQLDGSGSKLPYIDAVLISFVKDRNAAFLDLVKGNLDMLSGLEGSYKDALIDPLGNITDAYKDEVELVRMPWLKTDYLGFLLDTSEAVARNTPWQDVRVRQALNFALDREKLVRYILNGIGRPANSGFVPVGLPSHDPQRVRGYAFDLERARELLASAGFIGGEGLPPLVLTTTASYLELCEFIAHEFKRIGVRVQVDVVPLSTHKEGVSHGDMVFFRKSWLADYPDAENFLLLFYSQNKAPEGPNYTRFSNVSFDRLFEQAMATSDDGYRTVLYQRMDSILVADAPVIFMYYPEVVRFVRKGVTGLSGDPMNMLDLRRVRK